MPTLRRQPIDLIREFAHAPARHGLSFHPCSYIVIFVPANSVVRVRVCVLVHNYVKTFNTVACLRVLNCAIPFLLIYLLSTYSEVNAFGMCTCDERPKRNNCFVYQVYTLDTTLSLRA